jgi:hypothetical protein
MMTKKTQRHVGHRCARMRQVPWSLCAGAMPLIDNPGAAAVRIATAIVWGFLLIFATVVSSYADNRVALVIGNSSYASVAALPNPKRDAEAVTAALRNVGFQSVTMIADAGRETLVKALGAFAREADGADWALVYFAGHGIEVGGTNYLIPVDARLVSDRDVSVEAISLDQIMTYVEGAKRLRVVILDACRENPFLAKMLRKVRRARSAVALLVTSRCRARSSCLPRRRGRSHLTVTRPTARLQRPFSRTSRCRSLTCDAYSISFAMT